MQGKSPLPNFQIAIFTVCSLLMLFHWILRRAEGDNPERWMSLFNETFTVPQSPPCIRGDDTEGCQKNRTDAHPPATPLQNDASLYDPTAPPSNQPTPPIQLHPPPSSLKINTKTYPKQFLLPQILTSYAPDPIVPFALS